MTTSPPAPERLRETWLVGRREVVELVGAYLGLVVFGLGLDVLVVRSDRPGWIGRRDDLVADWFVARRTPRFDALSLLGSWLAESVVKIGVTALIVVMMLRLWRRWFEASVVAGALVVEALAFVTITHLIGRPRPDVVRLDDSPISSSFPSGHTAAAAAYGALVVVLAWRWRRPWVSRLGWGLVVIVTATVGVARMYRGMHHLSDVIAGALLGFASVGAVSVVMRGALVRRTPTEQSPATAGLAHG